MKKSIVLTLLFVLAASPAFAGHRDADLKLSVFQNQAFTMTLNGLHYTRPDNAFILRDLTPGRQYLEVRSACGTRVLFRGNIYLDPATQVKAKIDQRGRFVVKEKLAKGGPAAYPVGVCGTPPTVPGGGGIIVTGGNQPYGVYSGHPGNNSGYYAPMSAGAFHSLLRSLDAQHFDNARLAIAQDAFNRHVFTSQQLRKIVSEMRFETARLEAAKLGYNSLVDPHKVHLVTNEFRFAATTSAFYAWIS